MSDLVIVSMHEKGFPQADFYRDCGDMSPTDFEGICPSPDDFFTMRREDSLAMAQSVAAIRWPGAKIVLADDDGDDEDDDMPSDMSDGLPHLNRNE